MRVTVYCPDTHLQYDGMTPESTGVGGGVTARIRMAAALASLGDDVEVFANCSGPSTHAGVRWHPLHKAADHSSAGVLIVHSSGGALDVTSAASLAIEAKLRILLVSGVPRPNGADRVRWDAIYPPSNFIADVIRRDWNMPGVELFTSPYGVRRFASWSNPDRDPYRLIYTSHPSKGFESAKAVLRLLRARDPRFVLHVFGGDRLWGQAERDLGGEPGVCYHGMVGQDRLWRAYTNCGFALHLQSRPEPFGICLVESMAAGCVAVASPVGAYTEILRNSENGFLVEGFHEDPATHLRAANLILDCVANRCTTEAIRCAAAKGPLNWVDVARAWRQHWQWLLDGASLPAGHSICPDCGASRLECDDGMHCVACGGYRPR
jgi:glycosyltransferase involved in cell wall biosynthesis